MHATAMILAASVCTGALAQGAAQPPTDDRAEVRFERSWTGAEEPLVTDRPDVTESTEAVRPGRLQVEMGFTLARDRRAGDTWTDLRIPETLLRIGLVDNIELRIELPAYARVSNGDTVDGATDMSVGAKWKFREEAADSWIPAMAVIGGVTLPTGDDEFSSDEVDPFAILAAGWTLSETLSLGANLGLLLTENDGGSRTVETTASAALGIAIDDQWGTFVEYAGVYPRNLGSGPVHSLNTGVTYLLSPNVQLDALVGFGINSRAEDVVVGAGVSWRF
jgi:hypothetical protein